MAKSQGSWKMLETEIAFLNFSVNGADCATYFQEWFGFSSIKSGPPLTEDPLQVGMLMLTVQGWTKITFPGSVNMR